MHILHAGYFLLGSGMLAKVCTLLSASKWDCGEMRLLLFLGLPPLSRTKINPAHFVHCTYAHSDWRSFEFFASPFPCMQRISNALRWSPLNFERSEQKCRWWWRRDEHFRPSDFFLWALKSKINSNHEFWRHLDVNGGCVKNIPGYNFRIKMQVIVSQSKNNFYIVFGVWSDNFFKS